MVLIGHPEPFLKKGRRIRTNARGIYSLGVGSSGPTTSVISFLPELCLLPLNPYASFLLEVLISEKEAVVLFIFVLCNEVYTKNMRGRAMGFRA